MLFYQCHIMRTFQIGLEAAETALNAMLQGNARGGQLPYQL